jgi:hypothetical protein
VTERVAASLAQALPLDGSSEDSAMSNTATFTAIVVGLLLVAAVVFGALVAQRRAQVHRAILQQRFGPEYDRAVAELGTSRAERELWARARRVEHLRFNELSATDRARFAAAWDRIQGQFVDDPAGAAVGANQLIKEVMRARGYPTDDFEQRIADLSVDHASVVQHYRAARALSAPRHDGRVDTEELRQAVVHYRALFADLLKETGPVSRPMREVHA